jgi:hypothetical protein
MSQGEAEQGERKEDHVCFIRHKLQLQTKQKHQRHYPRKCPCKTTEPGFMMTVKMFFLMKSSKQDSCKTRKRQDKARQRQDIDKAKTRRDNTRQQDHHRIIVQEKAITREDKTLKTVTKLNNHNTRLKTHKDNTAQPSTTKHKTPRKEKKA